MKFTARQLFRKVAMNFESTLAEVLKLPVADRLSLIQQVLDSVIGEFDEEAEFSPAFRAELDWRIAEDKAHPERGIPWEVVEAESAAKEG
jgi:putative addiction module component (TIGR02574 family)